MFWKIVTFLLVLVPAAVGADGTPAPLPFSPSRKAGPTLYVSGQVARKPDGTKVLTTIDAETRQVMANIERILQAEGYGWDHVVSATVYLRNIKDYNAMNGAYRDFFKGVFPARACVGGQDLVADYNVEISVIAYKEP